MAIEALNSQQFQSKYMKGTDLTSLVQPTVVEDNTNFFQDFTGSMSAAFEIENTAGSYFADSTRNTTNDVEEGYDVFNDLSGYEDNASAFIGVRNSARSNAIKANIDRETAAKQVIAQAGAGGIAASMVASIFDPVDWAIAAGTGGIGILAKGGKIVKIGAEATIATLGTEVALQATQETRSLDDSLINIMAAPAMLGVVKASQVGLKMAGRAGIPKNVDMNELGDDIVESMTDGVDYRAATTGANIPHKNLNAAETRMEGFNGIEETKLAKSHWTRAAAFEGRKEGVETVTGKTGEYAMYLTPIGRLAGSSSQVSREYVHSFLENGLVTKGNLDGVAKDISVETSINRMQSQLLVANEDISTTQFLSAKKDGYTGSNMEFQEEVGKALSNNDQHPIPAVQEAAKQSRLILDRIKADAQEVGLLPKEMDGVVGAESYFTRVYNRQTLRDSQNEFRNLLAKNFEDTAIVTKAEAEATNKTLKQMGIGISDDEMFETKVSKSTNDEDVDYLLGEYKTEFDNDVSLYENNLSDIVPEHPTVMLFNDLEEAFAGNVEVLDILEGYRKKVNVKSETKRESAARDLVLDIKNSFHKDLTINVDDTEEFRNAAIRAEQNILGDGMFKPHKVDTTGNNFSPNLNSKFHKRVLTLTDQELEKFLVKDANAVIRRNIMSLIPQIQMMKKQHKMGIERPDLELTEIKKKIKDEYQEKLYLLDKDKLVENVRSGKFFEKGTKLRALVKEGDLVESIRSGKFFKDSDAIKSFVTNKDAVGNVTEAIMTPLRESGLFTVKSSKAAGKKQYQITGFKDGVIPTEEQLKAIVTKALHDKDYTPKNPLSSLIGKAVFDDITKDIFKPLISSGLFDVTGIKVGNKNFYQMKGFKDGVAPTEEQLEKVLTKALADKSSISKWSKKYSKQMTEDLRDLDATRQLLLGEQRYPSDPNSFWNTSARNLRSINYMSMLGGVAISSMTDLARHGMVNGLRGCKPLFKKNSWNKYINSIPKTEAQRMGVVAELVLNKRAAELADINEGIHEVGAWEKTLGNLSNTFSKLTGMSDFNDFNKQVATGVTQDIILEAAEKVLKGKALEKDEMVRFAENGLDVDTLKRIGEQHKLHGETIDGLRLGMASKWEDMELAEMYSDVLRKQADMTIVSPSVGDKPLWASSNEFAKSVFQFQSFMFAATNRQTLAGASYNAKSVIPWMCVQLTLGFMVVGIKDSIAGKEPRDWDEDFVSNTMEIVDRSGVVPLFSYVSKAGQAAGLTSRNRYEESGAVGSLLGPSLSTLERTQGIVRDIFDGKGYQAASNFSKMLPFQNHPAVQILELGLESQDVQIRK